MEMSMIYNRPSFVGSETSGVDGGSEGGRLSTGRLATTLVLYSVPLLASIRRSGYRGKLNAEPALVGGEPVLKVTYEGDVPPDVAPLWHGHRVVVEKASDGGG
jgi:hypothetical protein